MNRPRRLKKHTAAVHAAISLSKDPLRPRIVQPSPPLILAIGSRQTAMLRGENVERAFQIYGKNEPSLGVNLSESEKKLFDFERDVRECDICQSRVTRFLFFSWDFVVNVYSQYCTFCYFCMWTTYVN